MKYLFAISLLPALGLSACKNAENDEDSSTSTEMSEPVGSYDIDPRTGEISATHTDAAGITTTMRAGETVEARFPDPFTVYPSARITNTTRVEKGEGAFVTVEFTSPDPRMDIVEFYRAQAKTAGIDPDIEVDGGETTTLGGENLNGQVSFALQVTRVGDLTEGQLSVASGFD